MDLQELRLKIDAIDDELINLFQQRMDISAEVARHKKLHSIPVHDPVREKEVLDCLSGKAKEEYRSYIIALYKLLFELSRTEQERVHNNFQEVL